MGRNSGIEFDRTRNKWGIMLILSLSALKDLLLLSSFQNKTTVERLMEVLPSGSSQELHVLAVDDSYVDRKVIEKLLKISSCKVTAVESGARALQFLGLDGEKGSLGFSGLKVNLIMTDYSMPGMTGYELLKKIKRSSEFREIPVVIMSSENILTRIDSCMEEGAEEFIVKPVKLSDVRRLMKDCIMRGETQGNAGRRDNKRKFKDENNTSSLSLSSSTPSSPSSLLTAAPFGCDVATSKLVSPALYSSKRVKVQL